jgi:hypothetical protein
MLNNQGLDWSEWMAAAGYDGASIARLDAKQTYKLRNAWEKGHNPSGYLGTAPPPQPACSCGVPQICPKHG